jgi:hypothetical protein
VSGRARGAGGWGQKTRVWMYCVQVREYSCNLYLRVRLALYFYVRPARPSCMVMSTSDPRAPSPRRCAKCARVVGVSRQSSAGGWGPESEGGGGTLFFVLLSPRGGARCVRTSRSGQRTAVVLHTSNAPHHTHVLLFPPPTLPSPPRPLLAPPSKSTTSPAPHYQPEGLHRRHNVREWILHNVWRWVCLPGRHGRLHQLRKRQVIQRLEGDHVLDVRGW